MLAGGTLLPQLWVALVIQLPSACLEGARPELGEGGGVRVREGRGRGIKGPRGPTLPDAEAPWDNCGQRLGSSETGPRMRSPVGRVSLKMKSPERLGLFIRLPQKDTPGSPALCSCLWGACLGAAWGGA